MTECGSLYHFHYTSIVQEKNYVRITSHGTKFYENCLRHVKKKNQPEFQTSPRVANVSLRSLRLAETAEIKLVKGEKIKGRWNGRRKVILPFPFRVFLLPPPLPNNPVAAA